MYDTYEREENTTSKFQPVKVEDVIKKAYLHKIKLKIERHISISEKEWNDNKVLRSKQSIEEVSIQRAVKTTTQIFFDKGLFDFSAKADEVLKNFLFVTRPRPDLKKADDDVIEGFYY